MDPIIEIVDIEAPSEAQAGQEIRFSALVKNNSSVHEFIAVMMYFWDGAGWVLITEFDTWHKEGFTGRYTTYFNMPNVDSGVYVHAWRWEEDHWVLDDGDSRSIKLITEVTYDFSIGYPIVSAV